MRKEHAQTDQAWLQEAHRRYLAYLRGEPVASEAEPARAEPQQETASPHRRHAPRET